VDGPDLALPVGPGMVCDLPISRDVEDDDDDRSEGVIAFRPRKAGRENPSVDGTEDKSAIIPTWEMRVNLVMSEI